MCEMKDGGGGGGGLDPRNWAEAAAIFGAVSLCGGKQNWAGKTRDWP